MSHVSSASLDADTAGARGRRRAAILLVDHLGSAQVRAVRQAFADGHEVACLTIAPGLAEDFRERVCVLGKGAVPGFEEGALLDCTFDLVERTAEELLGRRPWLARTLAATTHAAEFDRYVCRALLRDAGTFLGLLGFATSGVLARYDEVVVERHWPSGPCYALVSRVAREHALPMPVAYAQRLQSLHFQVEDRPALLSVLLGVGRTLRELAALWSGGFRLLRLSPRRLPRRPFLIRTYAWDWGFDRGGHRRLRNVDFVVDDKTIRRDEVAIWKDEPLHAEDEIGLAERGYAVIGREDVRVRPLHFLSHVLPRLVAAAPIFLRLSSAESWWPPTVRRLFLQTLLWQEVARQVRPRVLFTVNDLQEEGIARTFVMRRAGCQSVEYEFSSHWRADARGWVPDYVYGFAVVDAMVTWGRLHSEHLRNHRGAFREFWEVGCLWSEHARLVAEGVGVGTIYREALKRDAGLGSERFDHVVGVFDTSTASFFGHDVLVAFYAGIAALAERFPRVLFVCKPKRPPAALFASSPDGRRIETTLAAAPNVAILDPFFETAGVVGVADLTVSVCFTSPAVESIGLGRPAVYYDPTGVYPNSFLRSIPRFVATNEDELAALVQEQLGIEDAELAADLRVRFSELEGRFDGLAITRLRERLRAVLDA